MLRFPFIDQFRRLNKAGETGAGPAVPSTGAMPASGPASGGRVGLDLGSRTIKLAWWRNGELVAHRVVESGFDPRGQALRLLAELAIDPTTVEVVATGYGRNLAKEHFARRVITEIKAHALGARRYFPACRLLLDVGGQDVKVIRLAADGRVLDFQMNDKCAAGTGRFLEIMAQSLGFTLAEFGPAALQSNSRRQSPLQINSMCTVFAESEVIGLKNQGQDPAAIALAVHRSVVTRLQTMLHRAAGGTLPTGESLVFSGGVARNPCIVSLLEEQLEVRVQSPPRPELTGAVGAALHGSQVFHSASAPA